MSKLRDDAAFIERMRYALAPVHGDFKMVSKGSAAAFALLFARWADEALASASTPGAPAPTPALCTHPAIDIDGLCEACRDKVALAVPVEFARRVAEIDRAAATLPAVAPEPTLKPGQRCVKHDAEMHSAHEYDPGTAARWALQDNIGRCVYVGFAVAAVTPVGEPARCPTCRGDGWCHGPCGDCHGKCHTCFDSGAAEPPGVGR